MTSVNSELTNDGFCPQVTGHRSLKINVFYEKDSNLFRYIGSNLELVGTVAL